jgi:hypothetical protein
MTMTDTIPTDDGVYDPDAYVDIDKLVRDGF